MTTVTDTVATNPIDALLHSSWNAIPGTAQTLTFSFMTAPAADGTAKDATGFAAMSVAQQQAARAALATWATVANLTFTEVASGGQIEFGTNDQGSTSGGYAYEPPGLSGHTYLYLNNNNAPYNTKFTPGAYGNMLLLHELGHTLGLKHPGNYDTTGATVDGPFLPVETDNTDYTVMSYHFAAHQQTIGLYAATPMQYDIAAMQHMYGANTSYHAGDDVYRFGITAQTQCIWDAGGNNTFDFSTCPTATIIDLRAGHFSSVGPQMPNISIAFGVTIQNAITGNAGSTVYCNDQGDHIQGGNGADRIYAGLGADTIDGGAGNDTVYFNGNQASFQLRSTVDGVRVIGGAYDWLSNVETLVFNDATVSVSSLALADKWHASAGDDHIIGTDGIDTVTYDGAQAGYTIAISGNTMTVTDHASNGGVDTLTGIERLKFADSTLALDTSGSGAAGEAYRLYQAAFNRAPDSGGLGFWINQLDHGTTLRRVAQYFVDSPEFSATYGKLDDTQFVTQMYANVLHRAPDADGMKFYLDALSHDVTRAQVLQGFSESAENQAALIGVVSGGVHYTPVVG